MPDTRTLADAIDDLIANVREFTEQIDPAEPPGRPRVDETDLRDLLQAHFYDLVEPGRR